MPFIDKLKKETNWDTMPVCHQIEWQKLIIKPNGWANQTLMLVVSSF